MVIADTRPKPYHYNDDRRELRFVDVPNNFDYEQHPGECCDSCIQDRDYGLDTAPLCCCRAPSRIGTQV